MNDLSNGKMAVIGRREMVQFFSAAGFDTFFTDVESAATIMDKIRDDYALVVTTESVRDDGGALFPIVLQLKEII